MLIFTNLYPSLSHYLLFYVITDQPPAPATSRSAIDTIRFLLVNIFYFPFLQIKHYKTGSNRRLKDVGGNLAGDTKEKKDGGIRNRMLLAATRESVDN